MINKKYTVENGYVTYQGVRLPVIEEDDDAFLAEFVATGGTAMVHISYLHLDPHNMRINSNMLPNSGIEELSQNLAQLGQLHPIRAKLVDGGTTPLMVVDGNTRLAIAKTLGWSHMMATIEADDPENQRLTKIDQISANISITPTIREKAFATVAALSEIDAANLSDSDRAQAIKNLESAIGKGNLAVYQKIVATLDVKVWEAMDRGLSPIVAKELANCVGSDGPWHKLQVQLLAKVEHMPAKVAADHIRAAIAQEEADRLASSKSKGKKPPKERKITATTVAVAAVATKQKKAVATATKAQTLPTNAQVITLPTRTTTPTKAAPSSVVLEASPPQNYLLAVLQDVEDGLAEIDFTNKAIKESLEKIDTPEMAQKILDRIANASSLLNSIERIVSARKSEVED